jgi:hypothetical protein
MLEALRLSARAERLLGLTGIAKRRRALRCSTRETL